MIKLLRFTVNFRKSYG